MSLKNLMRLAAILIVTGVIFGNYTLVQAQADDWGNGELEDVEVAETGYDNGGIWANLLEADVFPYQAGLPATFFEATVDDYSAALDQFVETIITGQANVIAGVFASDWLCFGHLYHVHSPAAQQHMCLKKMGSLLSFQWRHNMARLGSWPTTTWLENCSLTWCGGRK